MNYKETVDWLFNQLPVYQIDGVFKYKLDLSSIKLVCERLIILKIILNLFTLLGLTEKAPQATC